MHIIHHKCEDLSAQHQNIRLIVVKVIFNRNIIFATGVSHAVVQNSDI